MVKNRLDNEEKIFHADCSVAPFGSGNRCFRTEQNDGDRVRLLDECRLCRSRNYQAAGILLDEWESLQPTENRTLPTTEGWIHAAVAEAEQDLTKAMPAILGFRPKYPYSLYDNTMMACLRLLFRGSRVLPCNPLFQGCGPGLLDDDESLRMTRHYAAIVYRCIAWKGICS